MSRYIDADELTERLKDQIWAARADLILACGTVMLTPTAEVAEIKRGRWIVDTAFGNDVMSGEQMVICSVCDKGIMWGKQNFCPNCGALMENEDE